MFKKGKPQQLEKPMNLSPTSNSAPQSSNVTEIMKGTDIFSEVKSRTPDQTMDMTFDEFGKNLLNMATSGRDSQPLIHNETGKFGEEQKVPNSMPADKLKLRQQIDEAFPDVQVKEEIRNSVCIGSKDK